MKLIYTAILPKCYLICFLTLTIGLNKNSKAQEVSTINKLYTNPQPPAFTSNEENVSQSLNTFINLNRILIKPKFEPKIDYKTFDKPFSVTTADLNNDGKLDLIFLKSHCNVLAIVENLSQNNLTSTTSTMELTAGLQPSALCAIDINNNGYKDIVVANVGDNSISIFRNRGEGKISFFEKVNFKTGISPVALAFGDFNNDGLMDIAVSNLNSNSISILVNIGSNQKLAFKEKTEFTTGSGPYAIAAADINNDGLLDIVVANANDNNVSVYKNISTENRLNFSERQDFKTGETPVFIAIADLDLDGNYDLVVANKLGNSISILKSISTNDKIYFEEKVDIKTGVAPYSVAIGKLCGNNNLDIVVANWGSNSISVFEQLPNSNGVNYTKYDFKTGINPFSIMIDDVNCDNKADVLVSNVGSNTISIFKNTIKSVNYSYSEK